VIITRGKKATAFFWMVIYSKITDSSTSNSQETSQKDGSSIKKDIGCWQSSDFRFKVYVKVQIIIWQ
jgi:hypothetical protein